MIKPYCTQNKGDCSTCSLVNYGLDCQNNPVGKGGAGRGQGRKLGVNFTDRTAQFTKRITPAEKLLLEKYLNKLRSDKNV